MYSIYADGACVYDSTSPNKEFKIVKGKLKLADSVAGSLSLTLDMSNACYNSINKLTTKITVYKDNEEIWAGRVMSESVNFWNQKTFECEGELAYLNDTIQPQEEYVTSNPRFLLTSFIAIHNANVGSDKQFHVGNVTVQDPQDDLNRYTNYETTIDAIKEKLIEPFKAHLRLRKVGGHRYLDLIRDEDCRVSQQTITFGSNLLDFTKNLTTEDYATVLVPRGAQLDESTYEELTEYLTVATADGQNGSIYVTNDEAVENYGWIEKVHDFEGITDANQLLARARTYLNNLQIENIELEVSAVDLSMIGSDTYFSDLGTVAGDENTETIEMYHVEDFFNVGDLVEIYYGRESIRRILTTVSQGEIGYDLRAADGTFDHQWEFQDEFVAIRTINAIDDIKLLDRIRVVSPPHGIDTYFPVNKVELDLCNPENDEYTLGTNVQNTLTSSNTNSSKEMSEKVQNIPSMSFIVNQSKSIATALINLATNGIVTIAKNANNTEELIISDRLDYTSNDAKVWRFNYAGLMYSDHGYSGNARTAITMNGEIVADFITAGNLNADIITVGTITDRGRTSYWNLETGEMSLNAINMPVVNMMPTVYWSEARYSVDENPFTRNGITWTVNGDGSITANGTATSDAAFYISNNQYDDYASPIKLDPNRTYFLSGCPAGGDADTYRLCGRRYDASLNPTSDSYRNDYGSGVEVSDTLYLYVFIWIKSGTVVNNLTFYPMLEYGATKHAYVSTHDGTGAINNSIKTVKSSITQTASEIRTEVSETYQTLENTQVVNLVPSVYWSEARYSVNENPYTQNGITWTLNPDGSVTASGTATASTAYYISNNQDDQYGSPIKVDPAKKYMLSGCPAGGSTSKYAIRCQRFDSSGTSLGATYDTGDGLLIAEGTYSIYLYLIIYNGVTVNNIRFYPMLEAGSIKHGYISTHNGTGAINNNLKSVRSSIQQNADSITSIVEASVFQNLVPSVYFTESVYGSSRTNNGITWTVNADGSITANGTATANALYSLNSNLTTDAVPPLVLDSEKSYKLSGCPAGGSTSTYCIGCARLDSSGTVIAYAYDVGNTSGVTISGSNTHSVQLYLRIQSGATVNNITFYPMFESGSVVHKYVNPRLYTGETVASMINQTATSIKISASHISLEGLVTANNNVTIDTNGKITAVNADISGKITVGTNSSAAGFSIDNNSLSYGTMGSANSVFICSTGSNAYANIAGSGSINGWVYTAGSTFGVTKAGTLYCTGAHISGAITATSGTFNGTVNASGGDITGNVSITGSLSCANPSVSGHGLKIRGGAITFYSNMESNTKDFSLEYDPSSSLQGYSISTYNGSNISIYSDRHLYLTAGLYIYSTTIYSTTGSGSYVRVDSTGKLGCSSSSRRYKHNIKDASDDYYDGLLDVKPSTFVYNSDKSNKTVTGLIAEDLEKHFPVSVLYNSEGLVNDWDDRMVLTGTLALLQKLYKRVEALESKWG